MEEKITDILNILNSKDSPSQREIAKEAGISLGLVNTLLKKCAKKGLIKIERLNSRNIKYILTPAGIKEKTKKTIRYVKKSYQAIKEIEAEVLKLAARAEKEDKDLYLYSDQQEDEILDLVSLVLRENNLEFEVFTAEEELSRINKEESLLLHWDPDLKVEHLEPVNIFI
ncbi:winged helix-turn-helix DNA-binding protein [Halanaerobium saccharolyticum]|uniref:Winged helix-turn-helix DNA-binding protein n=1 Tax=Halanaerobium saccharolyticum TaxID=43595 RepID=A0A4V3G5R7_9FIRM|nr:winged helix-turn-helix transcriptional regulator [Halanaerobium saccharolyticum]RAK12651.1 winged helix-turn-helix DNA-binding protein [Halanaerobium saccharolyticum]TDW05437.1 winged helix-turn-helix DNA-binding protein [Halanaerobium saccharolyticum]TDX62952.1 winged helix-turn-helix DNA-binding protein [Halanaerobium saccharolyticum]